MSKFFFKGRIELPSDYSTYNYNTDPSTKHGSKKHPISITVTNEARQAEIESQLKENNIFANTPWNLGAMMYAYVAVVKNIRNAVASTY